MPKLRVQGANKANFLYQLIYYLENNFFTSLHPEKKKNILVAQWLYIHYSLSIIQKYHKSMNQTHVFKTFILIKSKENTFQNLLICVNAYLMV